MLPLLFSAFLCVGLLWIGVTDLFQNPVVLAVTLATALGLQVWQTVLFFKYKKIAIAATQIPDVIAADSSVISESAWIAQACHDLRQPTMVSSLSISAAKAMTVDVRLTAHLDAALQASDDLNRMIQNILDFSELLADHRPVEMQPVNLNQVFKDLRTQFFESIQSDISLRFRCRDDYALGHAEWITRVLQNLIANALQHAGAQRILVTARRQRGLVCISVHDDGIGMSSFKINSLLHPISQSKSTHDFSDSNTAFLSNGLKHKNYGLGTMIALRYTRSLGSELRLRSQPGQGSHFSFILPLANTGTSSIKVPEDGLNSLRSKKLSLHVLVLTDRSELVASLLPVLQAFCSVVTLRGVREFMEQGLSTAIDARPVDVIVVEDRSSYLSATAADLTYLLRNELGNNVQALWITDPATHQSSVNNLPTLTQLIFRPLLASRVLTALQNTTQKP